MKHITDHNTTVFIQAYRSFLKAEGKMSIDQITHLYTEMHPSLHPKAHLPEIDIEAFVYSFLRLPALMDRVTDIVMAQTDDIFIRGGYDLHDWEEVSAPARRRKIYYDGKHTLAVVVTSVTDVDDVVCLLTAMQIEWNKMHALLQDTATPTLDSVRDLLQIDAEIWTRLVSIWGDAADTWIEALRAKEVHFMTSLLRGSYVDYKRATQRWFEYILEKTQYKDIATRPVYIVSSNTHSLVNNMTGWVVDLEKELIKFLHTEKLDQFIEYWRQIETGEHQGSREHFLWYILKKYEKKFPEIIQQRRAHEESLGIDHIDAKHYLDIPAQIIPLHKVHESRLAQKLPHDTQTFAESDALVFNIDYPLGFGAYMVLSTLFQNMQNIRGVYILGKASFLHGNLGDIGLPDTIYDAYSQNTYMFTNAFTKDDFKDFHAGSLLVNQKVVSSRGTFLHPLETIQQYFLSDYTIIEMENGPYLSAIYETVTYDRYPQGEVISLQGAPIDIGIIHYASDTPFTKAITLGTRNLGYEGVESTYVSSLAILKRILQQEATRLQ